MAKLLDLAGESPFKVRAYDRAAYFLLRPRCPEGVSRRKSRLSACNHLVSKLPRRWVMKSHDDVIVAMLQWSEDFIEKPNWVFGDLPVCPFAKAARLKNTIRFEVIPFDLDDPLEQDGAVMSLAVSLLRDPTLETLFVIHPDPKQVEARELEAFVARLNDRMAASEVTGDLEAFEAHPDSEFSVGGVYTRRAPYPSFQVLRRSLLKSASDSLLGSSYYDHFTPDMLRAVGMPRFR